MPALIDIRRRIRSVKNTQQITKALKMVSAAKLRRAQESMFAARPYARTMAQVLKDVASRTEGEENHPLFRSTSGTGKVLVIVVTADKGLCGAFNSSLLRVAQRFLTDNANRPIEVDAVGRKGRDFLRRRTTVRKEYIGVFQSLKYTKAQEIAQSAIQAFLDHEVDEVVLLYNEFKSVIQQRIVTQRLLPLDAVHGEEKGTQEYVYEPAPRTIFDKLLPKVVEITVWQALLESNAAEHGARMAAMDSATRNASQTIDSLTLYMNKVRQAAITKEIIEVVSGSAA
ncbi:MAG: ATP synthase F1 subunit gamma [Vicinamibacteria bacterium]|jgi:F-type H+-transporting ATPase subunit gamma|nr:ATP synthase F1 subunit gamma [Vicinamibacteria bacterium]MBP9945406.1 ATP synthase F1 subunit gamma [Vicinamibacteria bacterium]